MSNETECKRQDAGACEAADGVPARAQMQEKKLTALVFLFTGVLLCVGILVFITLWNRSRLSVSMAAAPVRGTGSRVFYVTGTSEGLVLRSAAGVDAGTVLATLENGASVRVTDDTGGDYWYVHAESPEVSGYVFCRYLCNDDSAVTAAASFYVIPEDAALYSAPHGSRIGPLEQNSTVTVLCKPDGDYWYVYSDTLNAYGYADFTALRAGTPPEPPAAPADAAERVPGAGDAPDTSLGTWIVSGTNQYLALRSEKRYDSANEIGRLPNGTKVTVLENTELYWYVYAPSLGMYGWVNGQFLSR